MSAGREHDSPIIATAIRSSVLSLLLLSLPPSSRMYSDQLNSQVAPQLQPLGSNSVSRFLIITQFARKARERERDASDRESKQGSRLTQADS